MKYAFSPVRIPAAATTKALNTFSGLVNQDNFRALGLDTVDTARTLKADVAIEEFMVRLDSLAQYSAGQEPSQLLNKTGRVTIPVLALDQTQSSFSMTKKGRGWEASGFGGGNHARLLNQTRDRLVREQSRGKGDYFEVRVPALGVSFIGNVADGRLLLTPLRSDARFGFEAGKTLAAEEAFLKLAPAAKEHNRLPT